MIREMCFFYHTCVMHETVLLSTNNICFGEEKEKKILPGTLILGLVSDSLNYVVFKWANSI